MLNLKNFKLYTPENPKFPDVKGAQYLRDEETGTDWYDACFLYRKDTMKVVYESDGFINLADMDAVPMFPINASVAEVEVKDLPKGFNYATKAWAYIDGKIVPFVASTELQQKRHDNEKAALMSEASTQIGVYQDMIDFDTDVEVAAVKLKAWKMYRIGVNSTKLGGTFPTKPE